MIHYKDMTFCAGDHCANFDECPRALTKQVHDGASAIGLPISQYSNPKDLECWTPDFPTVEETPTPTSTP